MVFGRERREGFCFLLTLERRAPPPPAAAAAAAAAAARCTFTGTTQECQGRDRRKKNV
jgi:hypothetical protein